MTALAERWWDTTNTFHLRFGEMTVTPLDFAAITGLRVGGELIPYDPSIVLDDVALRWFLGRVPRHSGGVAEYGQFTKYWNHKPADGLGAASRGVGDTIGGYWRVIELWAYEVLGMFSLENTCTNPHLLPRALAWSTEYRRAKERRGQVMTFVLVDNITGVTVHWDRWTMVEADFLPRSREVARSRVLLECPLGWQWYLGDRVTRQSLGSPEFIVLGPLPPRVQRTETYTRAELEQFTVPDTDLERYLRCTLDYATYRDRYLATSLGVERELERRVAEAEARRARGEPRGEVGGEVRGEVGDEVGGETGARGRGGRSSRGRGRGARPPAGGRGASSLGRGEGSSQVPETTETPTPTGLPSLEWTIGVRDPSGARAMLDIPRLPQPPMRLPAQVPREWAKKAIMLMVGMRQLLKDCAKGRTLQTRPVPEPALPVAAQVQPRRLARTQPRSTTSLPASASTRGQGIQRVSRSVTGAGQFEVVPRAAPRRRPALEESEAETEESLESRALASTDSSTVTSPSDDDDDDDGDDEVVSSESEGQQQKRIRLG
ncbi:hypothetical protein RHMOL_Rhmol11G0053600 [Rhododendron molle]|uniref:Uncharacterized protein n=1 Tax=Rhododendron molle TaxID=49168 RepID=A0ACC0LPW6_RHOML|nr:hypothetical protein RHMOL_Rhmol11G0053600 [Rhododendron molle]